jgi:hypothetical protein
VKTESSKTEPRRPRSAGNGLSETIKSARYNITEPSRSEDELIDAGVRFLEAADICREGNAFETGEKNPQSILCSDDACPCTDRSQLVIGRTAYLYISQEVVDFRKDCRTLLARDLKITEMSKRFDASVVFCSDVSNPFYLCETGARRRGLDLAVALADARMAAETGFAPLRPTPRADTSSLPHASFAGNPGIATETAKRAFHRHIQRIQPHLRGVPETLAALSKVAAVFHRASMWVGEKISLSANDGQMHSFSLRDAQEKVRLDVTTIPCKPQDAHGYFTGGYSEFLNRILYLPRTYQQAQADGIQIFAHVVVVVDARSRRDQSQSDQVVIHLCMLPHGDGNQKYCPVAVTPTDLLNK